MLKMSVYGRVVIVSGNGFDREEIRFGVFLVLFCLIFFSVLSRSSEV